MGSTPFGALSGVFVLVVDDNEDARRILQSLLTYLGAFVTTAATAASALNQLRQIKADVVTPFIAVSGQDYDEDEMRRAGFAAVSHEAGQNVLVSRILRAVGR